MKTLTKEIRTLPDRTLFWEGGQTLKTLTLKTLTQRARALPDRALFWAGALLLTTGALKIEDLPE